MHMQRVAQVEAGQDREDVSLQRRHQHLEREDRDIDQNREEREKTDAGGVRFHEAPPPSKDDVGEVAQRVRDRAVRWLRRRGYLDERDAMRRSSCGPRESVHAMRRSSWCPRESVHAVRRSSWCPRESVHAICRLDVA